MDREQLKKHISKVLDSMPEQWLELTTHRLDIYDESRAKTDFLEKFESVLSEDSQALNLALSKLPTAFDYIRLGHPISCLLEWLIAKSVTVNVDSVISFSSQVMPVMAILRKNLIEGIDTRILHKGNMPKSFNVEAIQKIYGYNIEVKKIEVDEKIDKYHGTTILLTNLDTDLNIDLRDEVDFIVCINKLYGSVVLVNTNVNDGYISEIQHVRRRESIAMTPQDCFEILRSYSQGEEVAALDDNSVVNKTAELIKQVTNSTGEVAIGSCGLSVQYAVMMGLIDDSLKCNPLKKIKFIVPPNCYGGTNDQARRVAACIENVEILDLPVDGDQDMVQSIEKVLSQVANEDAVPFIIAEIPTNPRVEVPDLDKLALALEKKRLTPSGDTAIEPVFILDQTFCPNVEFLGNSGILAGVKTISYVSGSKFPSGGLCTAGYGVANSKASYLMRTVREHLEICDNTATNFQVGTLLKQMPSMNERINKAYKNTRAFTNYIAEVLPESKINFVSEEVANLGFTPSVFSLDLPTKGESHEERELFKRKLNHQLIKLMINEIPQESKHCVSYGQLVGCYWTIPATSTQGTTKEKDKDYIVRVSIAPEFDLEKHKTIFLKFCNEYLAGRS